MPFLTFRRAGLNLLRVPITEARLTVGRDEGCDVQLPERAIAEKHFAVQRNESRRVAFFNLALEGSRVGGRFVSGETTLADGDVIELGTHDAVFSEDKPRPRASEAEAKVSTLNLGFFGTLEDSAEVQLRIRSPRGAERVWPWNLGEATAGRDPENTIQLEDRFVSGKEATLVRAHGHLIVQAAASRNGVRVNDQLVIGAYLEVGDVIRLGETTLTVEEVSRPDALPAFILDGESEAMAQLRKHIHKLGPSPISVLILGETGTGKERVAMALHQAGPRRTRPFVVVDCTTLTEALLESELFGHEAGAFTDAKRDRTGAFERADGGTIFLDEVGELPLAAQAKLLRVLQTGQVKRVGGDAYMEVDVRVMAATHRDLEAMVAVETFREDLWHRLNGAELEVPPLRDRAGDWRLIFEQRLRARGGPTPPRLSPDADRLLDAYPFPGNVRELEKLVDRALVYREGDSIEEGDLKLRELSPRSTVPAKALALEPGDSLAMYIHRICLWTYEAHGKNAVAAAKALGIDRATLTKHLTPPPPRRG
ncbi:MAG: sigma 54-interacting transcriptional regulator [Deltaproteobacteria bacterium]|nr:sigma 54-interacting transcriptional regulator [Deltaproteobacteria bacterium]